MINNVVQLDGKQTQTGNKKVGGGGGRCSFSLHGERDAGVVELNKQLVYCDSRQNEYVARCLSYKC